MEDQPKPTADAEQEKVNEPRQIMLTGHIAALYSKWTQSHKGERAPIVLDQDGTPHWLNRTQRRAMKAQARKAGK